MGNCVASSGFKNQIKTKSSVSDHKILRIIKVDGKVMEYSTSILVKDVLLSFPGFGVGVSKNACQLLSPDYELKAGRTYHLLPLTLPQLGGSQGLKPSLMQKDEIEDTGGSRKVKVLLTKQQLQQLLSMNISLAELISAASGYEEFSKRNRRSWKPELETIIEGNE
ncbi:hypothetical protein IEQ34_022394 [Dendrobium chrysotoxum]|uniref:Uncharacterized protein n=1 Tax=Dendrobium chrysotoxum TaxID=161865 RepID=A0AAV7FYV0_DENCH|nr:hypothetical protein IEQ34_022394 [Dendrobium chrysotoxum]